jgi:hypothetical protein
MGFWFSCPGALALAMAGGGWVWPGWASSWKQAWCEHMQTSARAPLSWKTALVSDARLQKRRQPQRGRLGSV